MNQSLLIRSLENFSVNSLALVFMASFHSNSFIDAINDPKTGSVEKELSLLFMGSELLDLDEIIEEAQSKRSFNGKSSSSANKSNKHPYPWWKLW